MCTCHLGIYPRLYRYRPAQWLMKLYDLFCDDYKALLCSRQFN